MQERDRQDRQTDHRIVRCVAIGEIVYQRCCLIHNTGQLSLFTKYNVKLNNYMLVLTHVC